MRRGVVLLLGAERPLTPSSLLQTIRSDPGMTSTYYANRYFGENNVMHLNHLLWGVLKRNGKVDIDRSDGKDAAPRWYPLFSNPKRHQVRLHDADEEDLSFLQNAPSTAPTGPERPDHRLASVSRADSCELESTIIGLVQTVPGKDIHYYIMELPVKYQRSAPTAFKRLREAGLLMREFTPLGTYVWR
ncbi:hypothetical protein LPMP_356820 [Leishmania panamensis]|uniref:Uncharacterized protein n=6 Tax=Viannia TaxID=37616 RepID=A4HQI6_LEIBR|nr:conserved hypothetical protein [Leishmania braziliensis MHOM/BR/75/M2904]XP_010703610.1 hypothetical protein LPMP_356820 [Leishmania panamensis]KAI5691718.1 hypothetical protein MNV84_08454 [Leishmania braziliensis]CCM19925.1 hypothetical protein, conserved [Leishmania guyanensis]AIO02810.1 hypothetical protein LPMP_356820 [Leishmania panamensis]CAJ2482334.1 unnamed protein product [Leishmania braziliensis]CAJ2482580.1 unnamed protein product [Leishmania braziliensis]